jgi:hypothetical protein
MMEHCRLDFCEPSLEIDVGEAGLIKVSDLLFDLIGIFFVLLARLDDESYALIANDVLI